MPLMRVNFVSGTLMIVIFHNLINIFSSPIIIVFERAPYLCFYSMTFSIVHAPALLPSEEDVRSRLHPPEGR